jgi:hypothetical protein
VGRFPGTCKLAQQSPFPDGPQVGATPEHRFATSAPQTLLLLQVPEAQSAPMVHACPFFFLHAPVASQVLTPVQVSASSALVTTTQVPPAPVQAWQTPQGWLQQRLSVQVPVAQSPVTVHISPFFALHAPAALHVLAPVQVSASSVLVTTTQVPPAPVQAWQTPQAWLQQRLSVQVPVAHSPPAGEHVSPFFFLHAPAALHVLVPAQVAPVASSELETVMLHVPAAPQFWHCGQLA